MSELLERAKKRPGQRRLEPSDGIDAAQMLEMLLAGLAMHDGHVPALARVRAIRKAGEPGEGIILA